MTSQQELENALARITWRCVECGSDLVRAVPYCGEYIPDMAHWCDLRGYVCPCLIPGSAAMVQCWLDLLDALRGVGYGADYTIQPDARHSLRMVA